MSFLTAPGTHRTMTGAEIRDKLGDDMVGRFEVHQHDATLARDLADAGVVMAGDYPVPVMINRRVLDADFVMGFGNIVPHCDAGYSGGSKIVMPGVCGLTTTSAIHVAAGFCPDIPLGMKDGNPCRIGMDRVARDVGLSFILNVVKSGLGEVCGVFAGDFAAAHRRGVDMAEESYSVSIPERADIVVASSYPADVDYWQAEKGVVGAYFAVKPGGIIIFAAPCGEGMATNHPRLREWLSKSLDEVTSDLAAHSPDDADADLVSAVLAVSNCRARDRADIYAVSDGLTEEDLSALRYRPFGSVQEALDEAMRRMPGATIGILPQSSVSIPVISQFKVRSLKGKD
jgi:nickel-dependent lactate racemase